MLNVGLWITQRLLKKSLAYLSSFCLTIITVFAEIPLWAQLPLDYSSHFGNLDLSNTMSQVYGTKHPLGHSSRQSATKTCHEFLLSYTVLHMFRQVLFGTENQGNHQNFKKSLLTNKI